MDTTAADRSRRLDVLVFLLLFLTYAFFHQGGFSNQNTRFDASMAMAFEHRLTIDSFAINTIDKVFVGGHSYAEKSPVVSYLALPVPLLASLGWSRDEVLGNPALANRLLYAGTALTAGLISALSALAFRRWLCRLNPSLEVGHAALITLVTYASTLLLPYSTMLFGHAIAGALLVIGSYAAHSAVDSHRARDAVLAGGVLSLAAATEFPLALLVAVILAVAIFRLRARPRIALFCVGAAFVPVALLLVHNRACFGSGFAFGYGRLQGTIFAAGMSRGLFGVSLPSLHVLGQLLFGQYRGLFLYSPVLLVAVHAWTRWPKSAWIRWGLPMVLGLSSVVLAISGYTYWQGGTCFGPRHLVALIPLFCAGLAYMPASWLRAPWFWALVALSTFIAMLGTAITPFVNEFELVPARAYWGLLRMGDVSVTPTDFLAPAAEISERFRDYHSYENASWNLGECVGLRGWWSLGPLGALWVIGGLAWRYSLRVAEKGRPIPA